MNLSKARHRLTFQKEEGGQTDDDGFPIDGFQDWKTVWAEAKTLDDRRFYEAAAVQSERNKHFVIRYNKEIEQKHNDAVVSLRVHFKGKPFDIVSLNNVDEMNENIEVIVRETE